MSKILDAAFLEDFQRVEQQQTRRQTLQTIMASWRQSGRIVWIALSMIVLSLVLAFQTLLPTVFGIPTLAGTYAEQQATVAAMAQKIDEQNGYLARLHKDTIAMQERQLPAALQTIQSNLSLNGTDFPAVVSNLNRITTEVLPDNPVSKKILFQTLRFEPAQNTLVAQGTIQLPDGYEAITGQTTETLLEYVALNANRSPYFHDSIFTFLPSKVSSPMLSFQLTLPLQNSQTVDSQDSSENFVEYIQQYLQTHKIKR